MRLFALGLWFAADVTQASGDDATVLRNATMVDIEAGHRSIERFGRITQAGSR
jgi:hypothetical protein